MDTNHGDTVRHCGLCFNTTIKLGFPSGECQFRGGVMGDNFMGDNRESRIGFIASKSDNSNLAITVLGSMQ